MGFQNHQQPHQVLSTGLRITQGSGQQKEQNDVVQLSLEILDVSREWQGFASATSSRLEDLQGRRRWSVQNSDNGDESELKFFQWCLNVFIAAWYLLVYINTTIKLALKPKNNIGFKAKKQNWLLSQHSTSSASRKKIHSFKNKAWDNTTSQKVKIWVSKCIKLVHNTTFKTPIFNFVHYWV